MTGSTPRETYRHGDLRRALIEAGTDLARRGGPDAVVLREATRRVGVAPNAAYRHFADHGALVRAVAQASMVQLANAIESELATADATDEATRAQARLRAVGVGYLRFAQAEPGLFRTAFSTLDDLRTAGEVDSAGAGGLTPFQLLSTALDGLVAAGVLPAERRPGAEFLAWSAVHGLAMLLIGGPLRFLDEQVREQATRQLLDMVERGL
jgi:AcrR family transcriptional regulator